MHVAPIACLNYVNIRQIDHVLVLVVFFMRTYLLTEIVVYAKHSSSKQGIR